MIVLYYNQTEWYAALRNDCNYDYFYTDESNISEVRQDWDRVLWIGGRPESELQHISLVLSLPCPTLRQHSFTSYRKKKALMRGLDKRLLSLAQREATLRFWG